MGKELLTETGALSTDDDFDWVQLPWRVVGPMPIMTESCIIPFVK
jgi:hypothetical protein